MNTLLLPLLATLLPALSPVAQEEPPVEVGVDSGKSFAFDWDGLNVDGEPHDVEIRHVRFKYTPPGADPVVRWVNVALDAPVVLGENRVPVAKALAGIPAGEYVVNAELEDVAGQKSGYSQVDLAIRVRVKNPTRPANVRVVGP